MTIKICLVQLEQFPFKKCKSVENPLKLIKYFKKYKVLLNEMDWFDEIKINLI